MQKFVFSINNKNNNDNSWSCWLNAYLLYHFFSHVILAHSECATKCETKQWQENNFFRRWVNEIWRGKCHWTEIDREYNTVPQIMETFRLLIATYWFNSISNSERSFFFVDFSFVSKTIPLQIGSFHLFPCDSFCLTIFYRTFEMTTTATSLQMNDKFYLLRNRIDYIC